MHPIGKNNLTGKEVACLRSFKTRVRITVDTDATPYLEWAKKYNVSAEQIRRLDADGGYQSVKWYVVEKEIPTNEWQCIELFVDGEWVPCSDELINMEFLAQQSILKAYSKCQG
ncbi:hypothetical protein SPSIL_052680 [Sporomusa silvacetica DSM 10669]|uniref:Uncharacterized protein n=1 Tax=Sporomusa silvacetica DSM 10669 TaxID=1123289 RepID=A0ABZ3ITJ2_9FIRM|nr:hypothetical protein SPSIL_20710 [Sporomusa silvacetica DSM 10669]